MSFISRLPQFPVSKLARRDFLTAGAITLLGLGSNRGFSTARADQGAARAKACILIWLDGGPSHLDLWDLKPDAPAEVRGPFGSIETAVSGVRICEHHPRMARMLDRFAIIRSMTSPLGEHNLGTHYLLTGYKPSAVLTYPSFGSVLAHVSDSTRLLPSFIAVPDHRVGGSKAAAQGFLPPDCAPFEVGRLKGHGFSVPHLEFYPGLDADRIRNRQRYLAALNQSQSSAPLDPGTNGDPVLERAVKLITSNEARKAFDLTEESLRTVESYGTRAIGKYCLLARRLVERGVPFVTINHVGWDTHQQLAVSLRDGFAGAREPVGLIPSLDLALSGLVRDLEERGLLDQTLVVVMGEFGRTPKINTTGGRDHWPRVFSVVLAGGGVRGGQVIGASDATGESPLDRPVTPADLARSIYVLLGIDPDRKLETSDGRPVSISQEGNWIGELC